MSRPPRRAAVHMPDITRNASRLLNGPDPACGAGAYEPLVTWAPNEVTCQRARCQEVARIARRLYAIPVEQLGNYERIVLRRLLAADRPERNP